MTDKGQPKEIEVPDAPKEEAATPPTLSELADAGFAPQELEMAKKHGMVKAEGDKDGAEGDKGGEGKPDGEGTGDALDGDEAEAGADRRGEERTEEKGDTNGEEKKDKKATKTVDERYRILAEGRSPEAIMQEIQDKGIELSPEQETILISGLTHNGKTLYWGQKKARLRAQKAEADAAERTAEIEKLRAENAELKKQPVKKVAEEDPLNLDGEGEESEVIDPKKKPLTLEDLERIEAEKKAKLEADERAHNGRRQVIHEALEDQQAEARERYEDFDAAMGNVSDILTRANEGTLKDLYPDPRAQTRIITKAKLLLSAFANADKFGSDQFNAADMAYELGKEHPEYGKKKPDASRTEKTGETDEDGNPEAARRAVQNANRRGSSATLNGGGSRRVALDELTLEQARRLPDKEYRKLPKAVRERLLSA